MNRPSYRLLVALGNKPKPKKSIYEGDIGCTISSEAKSADDTLTVTYELVAKDFSNLDTTLKSLFEHTKDDLAAVALAMRMDFSSTEQVATENFVRLKHILDNTTSTLMLLSVCLGCNFSSDKSFEELFADSDE